MFLTVPSQLLLFAIFFVLGFLFALLHAVVGFFGGKCLVFKRKKVCQLVAYAVDFLLTVAFLLAMFIINVNINYGVVRMFEVLSLVFGFVLCQMLVCFRLALPLKKCYDWMQNKLSKRQTHEKVE